MIPVASWEVKQLLAKLRDHLEQQAEDLRAEGSCEPPARALIYDRDAREIEGLVSEVDSILGRMDGSAKELLGVYGSQKRSFP